MEHLWEHRIGPCFEYIVTEMGKEKAKDSLEQILGTKPAQTPENVRIFQLTWRYPYEKKESEISVFFLRTDTLPSRIAPLIG